MNLLLWQLIDSAFPSGGFAHSSGLEASVQHGHVADSDGVRAFAAQALAQCGRSALPLVTAAHQRPEEFGELDELTDVFLANPVANRASRAQGRALVASIARSFDKPFQTEGPYCHYAPVFGRAFDMLTVTLPDTQNAFLFVAVRTVTSAAVRLGVIGAYDAQRLQADLAPHIEAILRDCGGLEPYDIAQTSPLIDLFQSTHDRLYSRLFQS